MTTTQTQEVKTAIDRAQTYCETMADNWHKMSEFDRKDFSSACINLVRRAGVQNVLEYSVILTYASESDCQNAFNALLVELSSL